MAPVDAAVAPTGDHPARGRHPSAAATPSGRPEGRRSWRSAGQGVGLLVAEPPFVGGPGDGEADPPGGDGQDTMVPHFSEDTQSEISAWPFPEGYDVFLHFQQNE